MTSGTAKAGRVVAVGGGKGGVGKSIISTNLAIALAARGMSVVLVDADLGAPNLHTMLGIARPGGGLDAYLDGTIDKIDEAAAKTSIHGLRLIAGSSRVGVANLSHRQKMRLVDGVTTLGADAVVVDLGAGTTLNTLDFVAAADVRLLVMTPQLTSMQNAYAFLKGAVHRTLTRAAADAADRDTVDEALAAAGQTQRIGKMLEALRARSPRLAARCERQLEQFSLLVIGNQVRDPRDVQALENMTRMIRDFLSVAAPMPATLPDSTHIRDSVNARAPFALEGGGAAASSLRKLADAVARVDVAAVRRTRAATTAPARRSRQRSAVAS